MLSQCEVHVGGRDVKCCHHCHHYIERLSLASWSTDDRLVTWRLSNITVDYVSSGTVLFQLRNPHMVQFVCVNVER